MLQEKILSLQVKGYISLKLLEQYFEVYPEEIQLKRLLNIAADIWSTSGCGYARYITVILGSEGRA